MDRQTFEIVNFPFSYSSVTHEGNEIANIPYADLRAYARLVKIAYDLLPQNEDHLRNIVAQIKDHLDNNGELPPLRDDAVREFTARLDSVLKNHPIVAPIEIAIALIAALFAETAFAAQSMPNLAQSKFGLAITIEISSYVSWKSMQEVEFSSQASMSESLQNFEKSGKDVIAHASEQLKLMNDHILRIQNDEINIRKETEKQRENLEKTTNKLIDRLGNITKVINALEEKSTKSIDNFAVTEKNIAAFKEAIIEDVRGTETRKLWTDRGNDSWLAFLISTAVLVVFLLVIPVAGFWNLDKLLAVLKHIGDAATDGIPLDATNTQLTVATLSRLVVITFPLVLYLWVIRLVVRFNTRSLVLHDDARQRQTMMDTYFMLIAQQAASKEERGLILNALFRPSPGHGSDNIEPPSFSELVGRGSSNP
ncbi:MAG: hypothetical protein KUA43_19135 [Hoeflea sp.]|uniref:hypothetical protein n=1 Tax=Hoeflea sp. TaxID=1940281 RepID=UPI001D80AB99|nr:hypothetical protein [Hoeflea sp.]MBU4527280.1 hypothetical protein [Alphaproteobacteria bacterium]MBU4546937.1 hypothetical protein [Alphaproteobacteria bacterium]MBU4551551.1 hypothetical protein [Alphaproteobacteria bacterium]MBV1725556.1 hypothetical protein [Hoeflea sp.]MBV1759604.1 hypothetical protein [Hoeflea sp.]